MDLALGFERGTLKDRMLQVAARARQLDKTFPIETEPSFIDDGGVKFVVRKATGLAAKAVGDAAARRGDPFDPPDPDLVVADISETHVCVLNKYNVLDCHLLIVTRSFERQDSALSEADFEALWICLREFEGLGFYNGGRTAGASQAHKHLQMVSLPLGGHNPAIPIQPLLDAALPGHLMITVPNLPFPHAFARLDPDLCQNPRAAAAVTVELYYAMLEAVGLPSAADDRSTWQSPPYNLLVTRGWMMLVPRRRETSADISINALGFAGSLFVKNDAELNRVLERGPMAMLREAGG